MTDEWTRKGPFGLTIHGREARTKVNGLRFETGTMVHAVDGALVEWVTGAPRLEVRYVLRCGSVLDQTRVELYWGKKTRVTCKRCLGKR